MILQIKIWDYQSQNLAYQSVLRNAKLTNMNLFTEFTSEISRRLRLKFVGVMFFSSFWDRMREEQALNGGAPDGL